MVEMDTESFVYTEETVISDVEDSLSKLEESDWEKAGWPLISSASKESFVLEGGKSINRFYFWRQVLNPKNFIVPGEENTYDPKKDFLFVVNSSRDRFNNEFLFNAILRTPKDFVEDPVRSINYELRRERDRRSFRDIHNEIHPKCHFWKDFYDKIPEDQKHVYPIPSKEWRKKFVLKRILEKDKS